MKQLNHQELMKLYQEGTNCDNAVYSEQRSNILLAAGNHYNRRNSKFLGRVREENSLSQDQKLRLTKNHIQRICKIYENGILTYVPGVSIFPRNPTELQDQKSTELNKSVWEYIKDKQKLKKQIQYWVQDFVRISEVFVKIFWDYSKGELVNYEPQVDEMGQPVIDEMGQPVLDMSKPVFSGDLVFERMFAFNIFRAKEAKSMDESWFIGHRKMMDINTLKSMVGNDQDKLKLIQATRDETYRIFDGNSMNYVESENQCLVIEFFIKPCKLYPKGYFYITTNAGVLFEGELPAGKWNIAYAGFDENPTSARASSIIKVARPYQAEINRSSSQVATHQITLSDDKILIQSGSKIQNGGMLPGVRAIQYQGQPPQIMPGRVGDQFFSYIQMQIDEMYVACNLAEELEEKTADVDPFTTLYKSMTQKKKYVVYAEKFQQFLMDICDISLVLHKHYISDDALIPIIGKSEIVNIDEYKNTTPLSYLIKLEEATDDMETKFGRQLMFNNIMQFVGSQLDPKQLGMLIKMSPYANNDGLFEDLTLDIDNANNMLLALDRGKDFMPSDKDDPDFMMKKLASRMRKADFEFLPGVVQEKYAQVYQIYVDIQAEQQRKIQEAALGYVPMSGMAVVCDLYVPMPGNASKTQRARVPYDSLVWLLKRLEEQGANQEMLNQMDSKVLADVANRLSQNPAQSQIQGGEDAQTPMQPSLQYS